MVLFGILPTLRETDLTLDKMTPSPRYHALNRAMTAAARRRFAVDIGRVDQLQLAHDNVMLEACNTSFQLHVQVAPDEVAALVQRGAGGDGAGAGGGGERAALSRAAAVAGDARGAVRALRRRALGRRTSSAATRRASPSATTGCATACAELFREDIARFRIMLAAERDPPPAEVLAGGGVPKLSALRLHSGTIYRWNRVCYGITDGEPHLRIEHRVLPAGPTARDEVANAAFFYGLVAAIVARTATSRAVDALRRGQGNFFAAAREGLDAQLVVDRGASRARRRR